MTLAAGISHLSRGLTESRERFLVFSAESHSGCVLEKEASHHRHSHVNY